MADSRRSTSDRTSGSRRSKSSTSADQRAHAIIPRKVRKKVFRNPRSGCYVLNCKVKNCTSREHRRLPKQVTSHVSKLKEMSIQSQNRADILHKLVSIPSFSDPRVDDDEFKNLFHQYMSFDTPRIITLLHPPSATTTPELDIRSKQQGYAILSSLEPVYFLLCVSMGHVLELVRREQLQANRVSAKIYGRLVHVLREKLDSYKPSEAPKLVLCVLALSSLDMSLGNYAAVENHRTALQQLVSLVGIHHLGRSLLYVMSWDRIIAAFTGKPPLFAKMPDRQFLRSKPKHPKRYGVGLEWSKPKLQLDADVENLCSDVCRALEIAEAERWTFRPDRAKEPYNAADVQYLYYMRDVIQNSCCSLQARSLQNAQKSRPVLFGAMLVQYTVLGKNDLTWYTTSVAWRLYKMLSEQDLDKVWMGSEDTLCWLMCMMLIVRPWEGYQAAMDLFRDWVDRQTLLMDGEESHMAWDGLCNPQDFVWSNPEFDGRLRAALRDYKSSNSSVKVVDDHDGSVSGSKTTIVTCSFLSVFQMTDVL